MSNLWQQVNEVAARALASGAMEPIPTHYRVREENGIQFLIRTLDTLQRKQDAEDPLARAGDNRRNPFKPYDPQLYIRDIGKRHLCLLNKFNVVDNHILLVTRAFESQENRLNLADFTALGRCLAEGDALAFYNSGRIAGASQPHKHLQLIKLPMLQFTPLPFSPQLAELETNAPQRLAALPFRHAAVRLAPGLFSAPERAPAQLLLHYEALQQQLRIRSSGERVEDAYNLLLTREWMLMVPRRAEAWQGISVNALGYTGALLTRTEAQAEQLQQQGLMQVLAALAG